MYEKIKLAEMKVKDIRNLIVKFPSVVKETDSMNVLLRKMLEDTRTRHVYVVDDDGRLLGTVRMNAVVKYLFPLAVIMNTDNRNDILTDDFVSFGANNAASIMNRNAAYVKEETSLTDMAVILIEGKVNELPVVDDNHKLIGEVNVYEVMQTYLQEMQQKTTEDDRDQQVY